MTLERERIQLCGPLVVRLGGRRVEQALPGAQGRMLFAYLLAERPRAISRDELIDAVWPAGPPRAAQPALRALLSKLRTVLGAAAVEGSGHLRLALAPTIWVDVEAATAALHDAESAAAQGDWPRAWVAAHIARNVAARTFLAGHEAPWIEARRRQLSDVLDRALAALAAAGLGLGGPELPLAERAARTLVERAPYREAAHALLMRVLIEQGNPAEAVLVFDALRRRLRDDLGLAPSEALLELHSRLLRT